MPQVFDGFAQDLWLAARMIRKNPVISAIVILSVAVGVGSNLFAFGIADAIFWRPLPVANPDRLVALYNRSDNGSGTFSGISYPEYEYLRDNNTVLDGIAAYLRVPLFLQASEYPESIIGEMVTSNFFAVTGVRTILGRGLQPGRDRAPDQPLEMVLSHTLWEQRFGADPNVIGTTVRLNQKIFTVVGVADPEFRGVLLDWQSPPQLWIPMLPQNPVFFSNSRTFDAWNFHSIMTVGRVRLGMSIDQAAVALRTLDQGMTAAHPERVAAFNGTYAFALDVLPIQNARFFPAYRGEILSYVQMIGIVMAVLLAIAFLNLANLTIARSQTRRAEYAIRLALGGSHGRLTRQSVVENVVLTTLGGLASIGVAAFLWSVLASVDSAASVPRFGRPFRVALPPEFRIDSIGVFLAISLSAFLGILLGVWPAMSLRASQVMTALKSKRLDAGGMRWRAGIIVVQVAASTILLICAGLSCKQSGTTKPPAMLSMAIASPQCLSSLLSIDMRSSSIGFAPFPDSASRSSGPAPRTGKSSSRNALSTPGLRRSLPVIFK
jgi:predicted permease